MFSPGFTIIEVTLVLGIISTLAVLAFIGQGEIRSRARMTDAVDRTVVALSKAQNDADTTQNSGPGTNGNQIFFGEWVKFGNDSSDVTIQPLWRQEDSDCLGASGTPACTLTELPDDPATIFEIPNGVKAQLTSPSGSVVFYRERENGQPRTFASSLSTPDWPLDLSSYNSPSDQKITLDDGRGHFACITVKSPSGFIDKAFVACS